MADWVVLGKVTGLFGVQGWVKVHSDTEPRDGILDYAPLYLHRDGEWRPLAVEGARLQSGGIVLKIAGYDDRTAAAILPGCELAIRREQLPPLPAGEYYWADLEGLRVVTVTGEELGVISRLFATGANDVMVVTGAQERLIPFLPGRVVTRIDLEQGLMEVDWDSAF